MEDDEKPIEELHKVELTSKPDISPVDEMNKIFAEGDNLPGDKANLIETVLAIGKKENAFSKETLSGYKKLDDITHIVTKLIERRKRFAPKTFVEESKEAKVGIDRRLEDTDKQLNELIQLGTELVTNIRVANEKREVSRRKLEAIKRDDLLKDLEKEQIKAVTKFDMINRFWGRLKGIREPMGLFEEMEMQKERITELMKQKDEFIQECQDEIKRVDRRYYEDLRNQSDDIYCLVERIDNQIELMKNAYNEHLELLQRTIENERETLALAASRKWEELYRKRTADENKKLRYQKERAQFYVNEIKRISKEHEDMTRSTRIRLEKDAEQLQLELRTVKNNVMLNSEKLDYNYQVLQKRDEENVIIRNQQKRRLAKVNETISSLKKKISNVKINSEIEMKKLSREVSQLHANIVDLEGKFKNFNVMNEKKYRGVWDVNYQEVMTLVNKVLDIDKVLHEQQLGLNWTRPVIQPLQFNELTAKSSRTLSAQVISKKSKAFLGTGVQKSDKEKLAATRLLRSIIRHISDRAGFLIEDKLLSILKPYSEELSTLVRLDNIFEAINVRNVDEINSLVEYFLPYSWCPNCSKGIAEPILENLYHFDFENIPSSSKSEEEFTPEVMTEMSIPAVSGTMSGKTSFASVSEQEESESTSSIESETEEKIDKLLNRDDQDKKQKKVCSRKSLLKIKSLNSMANPNCPNHYFVVEPVLIIVALREFAEDHFYRNVMPINPESKMKGSRTIIEEPQIIPRGNVVQYWSQFPLIISDQKMRVWKALEHGLNHYLQILKERENLDAQCEFLRRQNAEFNHLLQKFLPEYCKDEV